MGLRQAGLAVGLPAMFQLAYRPSPDSAFFTLTSIQPGRHSIFYWLGDFQLISGATAAVLQYRAGGRNFSSGSFENAA